MGSDEPRSDNARLTNHSLKLERTRPIVHALGALFGDAAAAVVVGSDPIQGVIDGLHKQFFRIVKE